MSTTKIVGALIGIGTMVLNLVSEHNTKKAMNETIQKEVAKAVAEAMKKTGV